MLGLKPKKKRYVIKCNDKTKFHLKIYLRMHPNNNVVIDDDYSLTAPKKTRPARGWNAADICTNCIHTIPARRYGAGFRLLGESAVAP